MLCVECGAPIQSLYTFYSGDNIQATKCGRCHKFADRYIECDNLLVVIDLLLLRPAAIRHIVFNSNIHKGDTRRLFGVTVTVARLLILVTLFEVYLQWAMYETSHSPMVLRFLQHTHPVNQYALFMLLSVVKNVTVHVVVRNLARLLTGWKDGAVVSSALLICSFFKLLPILTFIWHYDIPFAGQVVWYVSLVCMLEVLSITLDCSYLPASIMTMLAGGVTMILDQLFWQLVQIGK